MKQILFSLLIYATSFTVWSQTQPELSSTITPEITVCGDAGFYEVKLVNNSSNFLGNQTSIVSDQITVNSQNSGHHNYTPSASIVDELTITNTGNGQVDIRIFQAVLIKKIIFISPNQGSSKLRAGGNWPYPSVQYCTIVDPGNVAVFENSVTQNTNSNDCASAPGGLDFTVALPTGLDYVASSLNESTNKNVQEHNVSQNSGLVFSSNGIASGDSIVFEIQIKANLDAISFQQQGNVFRNQVSVDLGNNTLNHSSSAYNVLYAALSILNVSPTSKNVVTGNTFTRNITIINAGNGKLSSFSLSDIRNASGLDLIATSLGTLNGAQTSISFTGADFANVGNNDAYFNTNEQLVVTQTLSANGCTEGTVSSSLKTSWGCNSQERESSTSYGHATISLKNPNLTIAHNSSLSSCFSNQQSDQLIRLVNNGQGYATNVAVDIYKSNGGAYNQDLFSAIDEASVTYKVGSNGSPISISPITYATRNDGAYSCLGSNPIGRVVVNLPMDIAPGETVFIEWRSLHCCINECANEALMGWKYQVDYQDMCGNNSYSSTKTGEEPTELNMTLFTETPTDINAGETLPFVYTISSHDNNLPVSSTSRYEVIATLPDGLDWAGGTDDFVWKSSPDFWTPISVNFNSGTREVTALFAVPEPFNIQKSEIRMNLTGNCSNANSGNKSIVLDINYIPDTSCGSCKVEMVCNKTTTTKLHCPIGNCEGLHFLSFKTRRTNYGSPDNDANGLADNTGLLNMSKVKSNRVMVGDTLETVYKSVVRTGSNNSQFYNFFVEADIDFGQNFDFVDGEIVIYDGATQTNYTCTNFQTSVVNGNGNSRKFRYSFLPNYDCTGLPNTPGGGGNFYFTHNDSITFKVRYRVTGNIGGDVEEVTIDNDLFTSAFSAPWGANSGQLNSDKWACDDYDGRFTLIGYFFDNKSANRLTVKSCTRVVQQTYKFSVGDCCDNFEGGNLFPYEYRNWAHIKEVRISIPTDYEVVQVYFNQKRTKTTNQSTTQTVQSLVPFHNSGGHMHFNLEQHYSAFGGSLDYSDDGFSGTVFIELAPTCDVPLNTYQDIDWEFQFAKNDIIGGGVTSFLTASPDRIRYKPTTLNLVSSNPIVDGLGRTVNWNLQVKNTTSNSSAANAWVHFKSPSSGVNVQHVIDNATGDTLSLNADYFKLGTIGTKSTKSLSVIATYSGCAPDQLVAYSGYECSGYPSDFAHFYCTYTTYSLEVEPKNAEPQVTISGTTVGDDCSNVVEVTIEVASVRFAHLDSIEVDIEAIGNTMNFISGSGQLKYPLSGSFATVTNPVELNGVATYKLNDINEELSSEGLVGVLDVSKNRFQLKFQMQLGTDFEAGDFVQIAIKSQEICGRVLPQINLAYDPSIQFNVNTIAGLSNDASDSWGIAWGDYDNDGFDDIYVAEYSQNKASFLYHNNGDGTFTKETSGVIVSDGGSAIAGTWGDYNNDGNLDLFVANNTGAVNALYKNLGNGNFTRISAGDIANYGGYCHGASWVDYNNDGHLDLFVTDYMPTRFNVLYKNNGDETFTTVTNSAIVQEAKHSIGATWADYDNDGDMDVFVPATNGQSNSLFRNNGAEVFEKMTNIGIAADNANSVGCSWGDYDNDGDLDLFVTNTSGQNNFFYSNDGDGTFTEVTTGLLVTDGGHSSSSNWVDFDNDGDVDLYVCNDHDDSNVMYINDGQGNFVKPENPLSENLGNSYSQAWSDYDNDGDLDVLVGNHSDETNVFFENSRASCNSWYCIKLQGVNSNRSAIGARISVKATINGESVWQVKEISAQTGGGAGSQNSLKTIFGLADAGVVETVIIQWPSGYRQVLTNQAINTCNDVVEGNGMQVCGVVYHDANSNCVQDAGEEGIPGVQITIQPGNRGFTTNANGEYEAFLEPGNYTIQQTLPSGWSTSCETNGIAVNVADGQVYCGNNFGNTTQCGYPNLHVNLGTTALRKGFRNEYAVLYGNSGAFPAYNVELSITFSDAIVPISSTIPWSSISQNANSATYTWVIDTVEALTNYDLKIIDSVSVLTTVGDELTVSALITDFGNDCDNADNSFTETNLVVGAIDPNDLAVFPKGDGAQGFVNKTQVLRYKIRFQNVGTYFAQNVYVFNDIPIHLDVNSMTNIISSHDYVLRQNGRHLEFDFSNICLPDSGRNEEASNGFVEFDILPLENVSGGTEIYNTAEIIFDYEDPLITNKVLNTIKFSGDMIQNRVLIQPNPVEVNTTVLLELSKDKYTNFDVIDRIEIYNMVGELLEVKEYGSEIQRANLTTENWVPGCYLVKVFNNSGQNFKGRLVKK